MRCRPATPCQSFRLYYQFDSGTHLREYTVRTKVSWYTSAQRTPARDRAFLLLVSLPRVLLWCWAVSAAYGECGAGPGVGAGIPGGDAGIPGGDAGAGVVNVPV